MQLKLRRSQRTAGLTGSKILFGLDARIEPTADESALIRKYGLGKMVVYDSEARKKHQAAAMENFDGASSVSVLNPSATGIASSLWRSARGQLVSNGCLAQPHRKLLCQFCDIEIAPDFCSASGVTSGTNSQEGSDQHASLFTPRDCAGAAWRRHLFGRLCVH